jgi:hypothetical protein
MVERDLVRPAFEHLTVDAFMSLPFEALAPTKALLKRFFSPQSWTADDDQALAEAVGPGEGWWRRQLDDDVVLEYGWKGGRFMLRVSASNRQQPPSPPTDESLAGTFDGPVVPEVTPNPRTIRFRLDSVEEGRTQWYESPAAAGAAGADPRVGRFFAAFPEVTNVLVGPDFVAVSLRRPTDWERLLPPVLTAVTEEFAGEFAPTAAPSPVEGTPSATQTSGPRGRASRRLDAAWRELGGLRPADPADLALLEGAAGDDDPFRRQVAANLLREAEIERAAAHWARLVVDAVRSVRRATVDAMVDVGREEVRPLLEIALGDTDAWVRWKALRGLAELGTEPSRAAIERRAADPDFRVRLEAAAALRLSRR